MNLFSPSFNYGEIIPAKFTCDGENVNPHLNIQDLPGNTQSLVLIMDDPDSPSGLFTHWVLYDIPITSEIMENSAPGKQGINDFGKLGYGGPCPGSGKHRYFFNLFALDCSLNLDPEMPREKVESAMKNHILLKTQLMGKYQR
ncbi:Phospholipid-binding protein [Chitinispirillum alkaliphilum]|nr:Phospholipid-binding protein [Chitinispirillum alkaliphilum]